MLKITEPVSGGLGMFSGPVLESQPQLLNSFYISPFVSDVSTTGLLEMGFTEPLQQDTVSLLSSTAVRQLSHLAIDSKTNETVEIFNAVELQLSSSVDEDLELVQVGFELVDFDGQLAHLQLDIESLHEQSINTDEYDTVQVAIYDTALTGVNGKHVPWGEKAETKMPALLEFQETKMLDALSNLVVGLICLVVGISMLVAAFRGSLVSTWIFINTLQLIAHVPLVATKLPANAHYFLLNLLSFVRLNFQSVSSSIDSIQAKMLEGKLVSDESYWYNESLHIGGYRFSFVHNMLIIGVIAAGIALVWLLTAVIEALTNKCGRGQQSPATRTKESLMNNFAVRFALEVYFELMICAMITLSSPSEAGIAWTFFSLGCLMFAGVSTLALVSLYFRGGPYVAESYAPASLLGSVWGVRPLHEDILSSQVAEKDTAVLSAKMSQKEAAPVAMNQVSDSNTQTMFQSNVPLNQ